MLRRALAGAAVLTLVVIALPRAQQAPAPAPTAAQAGPSSKIWIGHEAEYEEFLRTAKIAKSSEIKVGVTHPHHCYFESGGLVAGAVFKPLQPGRLSGYFESYRSEIAAYEMERSSASAWCRRPSNANTADRRARCNCGSRTWSI